MAEKKNFTIENYNGTDYDTLYPETNSGQVLLDTTAQAATNLPSGKTLDDALQSISKNGGAFQVGDTLTTARTNLGDKWLLCNGQNVNAEDYPELASVLDTSFNETRRASTPIKSYSNEEPSSSFQIALLDNDKFARVGTILNNDNHGTIYNGNLTESLYSTISTSSAGIDVSNVLKDIQYQEMSGKYICCVGAGGSGGTNSRYVYIRDSLNATNQTRSSVQFNTEIHKVILVPNSTNFYAVGSPSTTITFEKMDSITSSSSSITSVSTTDSCTFISHGLYLNNMAFAMGGKYNATFSKWVGQGELACTGPLPSLHFTYPSYKYYGQLAGNDNVVVAVGNINDNFSIMASTDFTNWVNTGFPVVSDNNYPCTLIVKSNVIIATITNGNGTDIYTTGYSNGFNWKKIQNIRNVKFVTGTVSKDGSTVYWLTSDGIMIAYAWGSLNIPEVSISDRLYTYIKAKS